MAKEPRYYQIEAKEAVFSAMKRGRKRCLVTMPGGTGKTLLTAMVMGKFKRRLLVTHEESLGEQSAIAILSEFDIMPEQDIVDVVEKHGSLVELLNKDRTLLDSKSKLLFDSCGMIKADLFDINKPFVVASAQTLHKRLSKIPKDWFDIIVCDEGDLFGSRTFKEPLDYLQPELIMAVTATAFRTDGQLMEDIFEEHVYDYPIEKAIKDKFLTEINAIVVRTTTSLDDVHTLAGEFNQKELVETVNTLERNNLIVNKYIEYCSGQQFICFGADVQHVIDLHESFAQKGIKTAYVVSNKDKMEVGTDRKSIVRAYREGSLMGLINYNIFSAGFDHRDCGCVILGCPTKSKRKFLQQLYRVTRLKTDAFVAKFGQIGTVLDIVDGTSKHVLVNTHELDKGKPIEERVFLSKANKQLLIEARNERERKFETTFRKEDKKVTLFKLPELKFRETLRMQDFATEGQLRWIADLGHDIVNNVYTKAMCMKIIADSPATDAQVWRLKKLNYDCSGYVSRGVAEMVIKKWKEKEAKK